MAAARPPTAATAGAGLFMDEVWCGLDLQQLPQAADIADDPFWPALADCTASFLAGGDSACFGAAHDVGLAAGSKEEDMVDATAFLGGQLTQHDATQASSASLSSSKRSLSIDSGGATSSPFFALDDVALPAPAPAPAPQDPFAADDAAIMRAMMAVLSSASPSSSESSSPPFRRENRDPPTAALPSGRHTVVVKSSSLAVAPEMSVVANRPDEEARTAPGGSSQQQVYHMMSERKRREKLNDSFQTLRSLLPPCSKKDKTTVLINAASYLKTLESQVTELEEKNAKLERHVPRGDDGGAMAARAAHRRAKVEVSRAAADEQLVSLTVMVMVECDIVDLVLHVLECLKWMRGISVMSVDADIYSPQALLKALASIKLQITDGECWDEASFHEVMTKAVHDATSSSPPASGPASLLIAA